MRLDELVGKKLTIALVSSEHSYVVKLLGVEQSGIWIESRRLNAILGHKPAITKRPKTPKPPTRPVFFIPYPQIGFVLYESTDLGE
jgi:hypothetical protein